LFIALADIPCERKKRKAESQAGNVNEWLCRDAVAEFQDLL
jgi:hypothetical protein